MSSNHVCPVVSYVSYLITYSAINKIFLHTNHKWSVFLFVFFFLQNRNAQLIKRVKILKTYDTCKVVIFVTKENKWKILTKKYLLKGECLHTYLRIWSKVLNKRNVRSWFELITLYAIPWTLQDCLYYFI